MHTFAIQSLENQESMSKRIEKLKKLKKIRIHHEGTDTLIWSGITIAAVALLLWRCFDNHIAFWAFTIVFCSVYAIVLNFFRCPIRQFPAEDTDNIVVAPADGKIVVIEEVEENEYFHDRRKMISIFMSLVNVHANWRDIISMVTSTRHGCQKLQRRMNILISSFWQRMARRFCAVRLPVRWRGVLSLTPSRVRTVISTSTLDS